MFLRRSDGRGGQHSDRLCRSGTSSHGGGGRELTSSGPFLLASVCTVLTSHKKQSVFVKHGWERSGSRGVQVTEQG